MVGQIHVAEAGVVIVECCQGGDGAVWHGCGRGLKDVGKTGR